MALTDILRSAALGVFLSCAMPTLATRSYTNPVTATQNAYLDMRDILVDLCCNSLIDSYPQCKHFEIDQRGFSCEQLLPEEGPNATAFTWDEIESVKCQGSVVSIRGKYDSNALYTGGPAWKSTTQQCLDLAEAMNIYLNERKKH